MKHYLSKSIFADNTLEPLIYVLGFKRLAVILCEHEIIICIKWQEAI